MEGTSATLPIDNSGIAMAVSWLDHIGSVVQLFNHPMHSGTPSVLDLVLSTYSMISYQHSMTNFYRGTFVLLCWSNLLLQVSASFASLAAAL